MRKHYVTYMSPGTFVAETTSREIPDWDVSLAARWAGEIVERHGARPFGFRFHTQIEHEPIDCDEGGRLDVVPRRTAYSAMYYLGGEVRRYDELIGRPETSSTLTSNMRGNGWPLCVVVVNGYMSTHPFEENDVIVRGGVIEEQGSDKRHKEYRAATLSRWREEDAAMERGGRRR